MLLILTIIGVAFALSVAKGVLSPVLFALVVGIVISPLADRLNDMGIPRVVSATGLLIISSGMLVFLFLVFEPILSDLVRQMPRIRFEIQSWIDTFSGLLRGIENLSKEIEQTVGVESSAADEPTRIPSLMDALWLAPNLGAKIFIFVGTLFFFVLNRVEIYRAAGPVSASLFRADRAVARYFAAVTIVNVGLGVATGLAMTLAGLENPVLWGVAAAALNYILYLGPLMVMSGLLIAGLVQLDGVMVLAPALLFLVVNFTEAQFVTPTFVGQRLEMSPLAVFLAIVFGLWLWGPVGAIIALPVALWLGVLLTPPADANLPRPEDLATA